MLNVCPHKSVPVLPAVAAALLALAAPRVSLAVDVSYGFDGCPAEVQGQPGEVKTFDAFVTLTTANDEIGVGAQGWSMSLTADGGRIQDIALDALVVQTAFDSDANPATPAIDPFPLDLAKAAFPDAQLAALPDGTQGAVSEVILSSSNKKVTLEKSGAQRIAKLTVQATIPSGAGAVTLRFQNGFQGSGLPIKNFVNFEGINHIPTLGSCTVKLTSFPSTALAFEGCPASVQGKPGEVKTFDVFATLTTSKNGLGVGAEGWSVGLTAEGGTIQDIAAGGIVVQTVYDGDGNPSTPAIDPFPFDLTKAAFGDHELAALPDATPGAISVVILSSSSKKVTLEPTGTQRIARITVQATVPAGADTAAVTLKFQDGFQGSGTPVRNLINFEGTNLVPALGSCTVQVTSLPAASLGFEGCPADVQGAPGEVKTVDIFATLSTAGNGLASGAEGWSISLTADGGTIEEIAVDGVTAQTVYDDDGSSATPPKDVSFDLGQSSFADSQLAVRPSDGQPGAVSAVILSNSTKKRTLETEGTAHIARIKLSAPVPASGSAQVTLRYEDGFKGDGTPIKNLANFEGINVYPALGSCSFQVSSQASLGHWRRCDSDGSGKNDITDAIVSLNYQFVGLETPPVCLQALDCDGSGRLDLTDAIFNLSWLFLGGSKPSEPYDTCGVLHKDVDGSGDVCDYGDAAKCAP